MFLMQETRTQCSKLLFFWDIAPSSTSPHPHQVRTTLTQAKPSKNPFISAPKSALNEYVNSLKTSGKSESNILDVLTTCFEEPVEEIAGISTPGALDF